VQAEGALPMNRLALPLVLLLLSVFGVLAQAQTFTQSGQFNCDAASAHPIQYAYQFTCRGVPLLDSYGNPAGSEMLRICQNAIIWGGNFFADTLPRATHWLVWDKLNTMPSFGDCELAWTSYDRKSVKKLTIEWNGLLGEEEYRDHPTQKPLALMRECLVRYPVETGGSIIDPFMGSGTMLVAAKDMGYPAIGIEIEEKYCEIAAKRLSQEVFDFTETK
jgi:hypothetical protein